MDSETTATKKFWSHKTIGLIAVILGIYSGLLVASINWYWMGRRQKAMLHLVLCKANLLVSMFIE